MKMKSLIILSSTLSMMFPCLSYANPVSIAQARTAIINKLNSNSIENKFTLNTIKEYKTNSRNVFYLAELSPTGYIVISGDDNLPPVLAYSYESRPDENGLLLGIVSTDVNRRMANLEKIPATMKEHRKNEWRILLNGTLKKDIQFEQWPAAGTTTTGGWLETNWTQSAPYNQMCPIDPVTDARSYTGCPATAMAQILNYHKTVNGVFFDDNDDYYHNYAGRTFTIDDDADAHAFPTFPQLNVYLDALSMHYQSGIAATAQDKAALSFACGVAATQVFTSEGSGTFGVGQAFDAYQKFNCQSVQLLYDNDTSLYCRLKQNMKEALPAHLAIVDENVTTGHNVVVDGYNTDNYYHVNFGWGGSSNGWYLLPDDMPYGLTVIEGLIVDILKDSNTSVGETHNQNSFEVYPNPAARFIIIKTVSGKECNDCTINLCNVLGQVLYQVPITDNIIQIDLYPVQSSGLYFVKLMKQSQTLHQKKIIISE